MAVKSDHISESTDGRGVKVVATATAGTTIHTATSTAGECDFITLDAYNAHTAGVALTLEWGGATDPDDHIVLTVPADSGKYRLTDRLPLKNGLVLRAFAGTANVVVLRGRVERASGADVIGL